MKLTGTVWLGLRVALRLTSGLRRSSLRIRRSKKRRPRLILLKTCLRLTISKLDPLLGLELLKRETKKKTRER